MGIRRTEWPEHGMLVVDYPSARANSAEIAPRRRLKADARRLQAPLSPAVTRTIARIGNVVQTSNGPQEQSSFDAALMWPIDMSGFLHTFIKPQMEKFPQIERFSLSKTTDVRVVWLKETETRWWEERYYAPKVLAELTGAKVEAASKVYVVRKPAPWMRLVRLEELDLFDTIDTFVELAYSLREMERTKMAQRVQMALLNR